MKTVVKMVMTFALVTLSVLGFGQSLNAPELQDILNTWRAAQDIMGISLSVISTDESVHLASGFSNPETKQKLEPGDTMYVGSITKTFIATLTLQLVEEGKLDLADSLERWYPDFPNAADITIAQLLNMTSGSYDYFKNAPDNAFLPLVMADINRHWTADEIISTVATFEPNYVPGEAYAYSNTNYLLLGQIIEAVTGQPVESVLQERLFTPLKLESSYLAGKVAHSDRLVEGYLRGSAFLFGQEDPMLSDASHYQGLETVFGTAGGLVSNPTDLSVFLHELMMGNLIHDDLTEPMLEPSQASLGETAGYGYGVEWFDIAAQRAVGHAGSIPGFASLTLHFPDLGTSLSVATNDEQGEAALVNLVTLVITKVHDD